MSSAKLDRVSQRELQINRHLKNDLWLRDGRLFIKVTKEMELDFPMQIQELIYDCLHERTVTPAACAPELFTWTHRPFSLTWLAVHPPVVRNYLFRDGEVDFDEVVRVLLIRAIEKRRGAA